MTQPDQTPPAGQEPAGGQTPGQPEQQGGQPAGQQQQETPPWGADFDPARAWRTIQNLRQKERERDELAEKVRDYEAASMTEAEKAAARLAEAEKTAQGAATEAVRLRVALRHGLSEEDLDLLGSGTEEEVEKRAKRLLDLQQKHDQKPPATRRPAERLRGGADPEQVVEETNPDRIAAALYGR